MIMVVIAMNKIKISLVSFLIFRALPVFLCGVSFGDVKEIVSKLDKLLSEYQLGQSSLLLAF
jgi:hypothetical protein